MDFCKYEKLVSGYVRELRKIIPQCVILLCVQYSMPTTFDVVYKYPPISDLPEYRIPFVFVPKIKIANDCVLFVGCENITIIDKENHVFRMHFPYVFLKKEQKWYRVYGLSEYGNRAGNHLAIILELKFVKHNITSTFNRVYSDVITDNMESMYFNGFVGSDRDPVLNVPYQPNGSVFCDVKWMQFESNDGLPITPPSSSIV